MGSAAGGEDMDPGASDSLADGGERTRLMRYSLPISSSFHQTIVEVNGEGNQGLEVRNLIPFSELILELLIKTSEENPSKCCIIPPALSSVNPKLNGIKR